MILSIISVVAAVLICLMIAVVGGWLIVAVLRNRAANLPKDGWLVLRRGYRPVAFEDETDMRCYMVRLQGHAQVLNIENGQLSSYATSGREPVAEGYLCMGCGCVISRRTERKPDVKAVEEMELWSGV